MDYLPTALVLAIPAVQGLGETWAMYRTGTAHRWRQPEWTFFAVNLPYWLLIAATLLEHHLSGSSPALGALAGGGVLAVAGIALRIGGHWHLGGAFSPYVDVLRSQRLVTTGLYRRIRHPMYLGTLFLLAAVPLVAAVRWAWLLAAASAAALLIRITKEESLLRRRLDGYPAYQARTWRMLPGVW